jgi:hypothetical protein
MPAKANAPVLRDRYLREGTTWEGWIDAVQELAQHEDIMPQAVYEKERRSSRVFKRVRVQVAGKAKDGRKFREICETCVVNAHGGLFYMIHEVAEGEIIVLTNAFTQEEQECRVVFLGDIANKGMRTGVEFLSPAPHFWGIEFAPTDWHSPESSSPSAA